MRIAIVLLGIAVLVYFAVQAVQRRRVVRRNPPTAPPVTRPSPRAEQDFQRAVRERAERQRRGTTESVEPAVEPPVVIVDDDVFGHDLGRDISNESFVVVSSAPVHYVVEAVGRANDRFMLVDEQGTEHPDRAALDAALAADGGWDLYTPNYAADPRVTPAGVEGYVDCKGGIEPAMGETLRRVLREELAPLGATTRVRIPSVD